MKKILLLLMMMTISSFVFSAEETQFDGSATSKTSRIVGGVKSAPDAWPSTVALLNANNDDYFQAQFCGGSLIAPNWVLTAAHCLVDANGTRSASSLTVLVGTSDLLSGGEVIAVNRVIVHPNYNNTTIDSDIALLELVTETDEPLIGFADEDIPAGEIATVVGWGATDEAASIFPSDLYEVEVPIIDRALCSNVHGSDFTNNMICAGYDIGGKDSCKADSGGPLMGTISTGEVVQVGITSWGIGCAQPGVYGVYTRLFVFQDWVDSYLNPSSGGGSFYFLLLPFGLLVTSLRLIKNNGK